MGKILQFTIEMCNSYCHLSLLGKLICKVLKNNLKQEIISFAIKSVHFLRFIMTVNLLIFVTNL